MSASCLCNFSIPVQISVALVAMLSSCGGDGSGGRGVNTDGGGDSSGRGGDSCGDGVW